MHTLLQPLTAAGLIVEPIDPEEYQLFLKARALGRWTIPWLFQYYIRKPPEHPAFNVPPAYRHDTNWLPLDAMTAKLYVHVETDEWLYRTWECIPGPCVDDVSCHYPSLAAAIPVVSNFFFGQPTVIDGWNVPLHRHPELNEQDVTDVIQRSQPLSASAFESLRAQRRQEADQRDISHWEHGMCSQYLKVFHHIDPQHILYLRRDAQEAIIVG